MKILTAKEVCDLLRLHYRTVIRLSQIGELPAIRIGGSWRYKEEDILNIIATPKKEERVEK